MKFLQQLIAAFKIAGEMRQYHDMADAADFWTEDDAVHFRTFLIGQAGKKFRARLSNIVFKSAVQACTSEESGDYRRGVARGVMITVQFIEQHLPRPRVERQVASEGQEASAVPIGSYEPVLS